MEQPVSLQAGTFLLSVLLGCGLGFVEIVLRAPRRLTPRLSWLMDLLLGIAITYGVLYALLVIDGGRLKFFDAAGILLGAWLFLKTLGRLLFPLFLSLFRAAGMLLRLLASPVTKILIFLRQLAKKYFSTWRKWGTDRKSVV